MAQEYTVEQLNHGRRVFDFMRYDYVAFTISAILLIASVVVIGVKGFNWGLDFTGGTVVEVRLDKAPDLNKVRHSLEVAGFKDPLVQNFGSSRELMIRMASTSDAKGEAVGNKVLQAIQKDIDSQAVVKRIEFVGPSVGSELAQTGGVALLVALLCIFAYTGFRFEWRLALGIVLSLAHDVVITMGILSLCHIEVDMTIVASLMSVIGYSLNDSIVVSDRIRENFRRIRRGNSYEIMNISITQTLSRTLMTSATTLLVVIILYIFGGSLLQGFSLTLIIGVFVGTLSSIYVASALALKLGMKREHLLVQKVEKEGADQPSLLP